MSKMFPTSSKNAFLAFLLLSPGFCFFSCKYFDAGINTKAEAFDLNCTWLFVEQQVQRIESAQRKYKSDSLVLLTEYDANGNKFTFGYLDPNTNVIFIVSIQKMGDQLALLKFISLRKPGETSFLTINDTLQDPDNAFFKALFQDVFVKQYFGACSKSK